MCDDSRLLTVTTVSDRKSHSSSRFKLSPANSQVTEFPARAIRVEGRRHRPLCPAESSGDIVIPHGGPRGDSSARDRSPVRVGIPFRKYASSHSRSPCRTDRRQKSHGANWHDPRNQFVLDYQWARHSDDCPTANKSRDDFYASRQKNLLYSMS